MRHTLTLGLAIALVGRSRGSEWTPRTQALEEELKMQRSSQSQPQLHSQEIAAAEKRKHMSRYWGNSMPEIDPNFIQRFPEDPNQKDENLFFSFLNEMGSHKSQNTQPGYQQQTHHEPSGRLAIVGGSSNQQQQGFQNDGSGSLQAQGQYHHPRWSSSEGAAGIQQLQWWPQLGYIPYPSIPLLVPQQQLSTQMHMQNYEMGETELRNVAISRARQEAQGGTSHQSTDRNPKARQK